MLGLATCSMLLTMLVSNPWSVHNSAGKNALLRGALEEAASEFRAAIREAEQGRQDKETFFFFFSAARGGGKKEGEKKKRAPRPLPPGGNSTTNSTSLRWRIERC